MKTRDRKSETKNTALVDEERIEITMGNLLRAGVLTAAAVVLIGGVLYLFRHGYEIPDYREFKSEPGNLTDFAGIFRNLFSLSPRGIIQFGLILLIATPVARVMFALFSFVRERDRNFIFITLIVLVFLLYGFLGGKV
jgi:uncharacterized membrane protein